MLLESLQIQRFGRFDQYELRFPERTRFAVLYGENGTGKTTLLNAFRSLLFGIEEKTLYTEGDREPPVLSGTLRTSSDARLEVTRYKRRKNPLVGYKTDAAGSGAGSLREQKQVLDDALFAALLTLPDRKLYEKVFGFTLSDLESGAKVLEDATVGELLAGGALGGDAGRVRDLLSKINEKKDNLYRPKSHNPSINTRKATLETLRAARSAQQLSETAYNRQQAELRSCQQQMTTLQNQVEAVAREEAEIQRLIKAYPHWDKLRAHQMELSAFLANGDSLLPAAEPGSRLSRAQAAEVRALLQALEEARLSCLTLRDEQSQLKAKRGEESPEVRLLELEVLITSLVPQGVTMAHLRRTLPLEAQEQQAERDRLEKNLARLVPGSANLEDIEDEIILTQHLLRVQGFQAQYQHSETESKQAYFQIEEKQRETEKEQRRLQELKAANDLPEDLAALIPVLDQRKQLYREWQQNEEVLQRKTAEFNYKKARLRPALSGEDSLYHLSLPSDTTLRLMAEERRALSSQLGTALDAVSDATFRRAEAEASLASLSADLPAPLPDTVVYARTLRARVFFEWEAGGYDSQGRIAYLQSVQEADTCADRLFEASERVARLAEKRSQVAVHTTEVVLRERMAQTAKEALSTWQSNWIAFWAKDGVSAACPSDNTIDAASVEMMIVWRDDIAHLQEMAQEIAHLEAVREGQLKILPAFEGRLRAAFQEAAATPLWELMVRLEEWSNRSRETTALRTSSVDRIALLQAEQADLESYRERLKSEMNVVTLAGQDFMALVGLPTETTLRAAEETLQNLVSLGRSRAAWEARQRALEEANQELAAFEQQVTRLRNGLLTPALVPAPSTEVGLTTPATDQTPQRNLIEFVDDEEFVAELNKRLQAARTAKAIFMERSDALLAVQARLGKAEETLQGLEAACRVWLGRLAVETEPALREVAEQADEHARLEEACRHAQTLLCAALGVKIDADAEAIWKALTQETFAETSSEEPAAGNTFAAMVTCLKTKSLEALTQERQCLLENLRACHGELSEEQVKYARLQNELSLRDGEEAALKNAQYEEERAGLHKEMEEYIVYFLAGQVLENVVERFARDNQPALLKTASSLVAQITDGQYTGIRQSADEKTLALVPACRANVSLPPRTPDRLSTGEREQMFLALRLAFVTQYGASREPLPIILDDVLVNFDERRAASTLRALADVSQTTQVLFFTCHKDLRDLAVSLVPGAVVENLPVLD